MYRGRISPESHFGYFALYVSFFPQLVAGPIERARQLIPQLRNTGRFDYANAADGLKLIAWGFFQKVVIADRLAIVVDHVYSNPGGHSGPALAFATFAFGFQILCDFGGYSCIAIGTAQVMGISLMENFRQPHHARSLREFWQRWHISLSTWFRDYLYIPLGGNRAGPGRKAMAILAVFALSGIWHGANWTFLLWGVFHGGVFAAAMLTSEVRQRIIRTTGLDRRYRLLTAIQIGLTFLMVSFGWILFRAASLHDAVTIIGALSTGWGQLVSPDGPAALLSELGIGAFQAFVIIVSLAGFETLLVLRERTSVRRLLSRQRAPVRWFAYSALVWWTLVFGLFLGEQPFIYFRF